MRHAFVPMSNGSDRCARCLRMLDCAPHLPLAPSPSWQELMIGPRSGMSSENRRAAVERFLAIRRAPAVSRAAR